MKMNNLSQIKLVPITPSLLRVYIRQNEFCCGDIDLEEKIFYSVPRTNKNLFFLFDKKEGSLGLNIELLLLSTYETIKIKFNNKILTCDRLKWLNAGTKSPYCNERVDAQILLPIGMITKSNDYKSTVEEIQQNLFAEAI